MKVNPITLNEYPDDMEYLDYQQDLQWVKYTNPYDSVYPGFWNNTIVIAPNFTMPFDTRETAVDTLEYIELFKGYDDLDYADFYSFSESGHVIITKPGCYVVKLKNFRKKFLYQVCRLDIPYDIEGSPEYPKEIKIGHVFKLSGWKFSYFYNSEGYFWDTKYDYYYAPGSSSGFIYGGRVSLTSASASITGTMGSEIQVTRDADGNETVTSGNDKDKCFESMFLAVIHRDSGGSGAISDGLYVVVNFYIIDGSTSISHIQRVRGSQLFCYLDNGTVIPFQRTGKNLYGYGSMQLSGVDYGSYMEVSVDGGEPFLMDYWQKRGIYVPRGGDDG